MSLDARKNFALSTVATAPSPATSGTSLVLNAGDGANFPAAPFNAVIWPTGANPTRANAEIVRVTAKSTDTLTITRTQESSSARTVIVGDQIMAGLTSKSLSDIEDYLTGVSSPTLLTPTIASFTNAQHDHSNAAGGGQIGNSGISGVGTEKFAIPYKFKAGRTSAYNFVASTLTKFPFDTEAFDTGSNFASGTFTAPIAGFYQFNARLGSATGSSIRFLALLYKNGSEVERGSDQAGIDPASAMSTMIQLAQNDTVEVWYFSGGAVAAEVTGVYMQRFDGYLVSKT